VATWPRGTYVLAADVSQGCCRRPRGQEAVPRGVAGAQRSRGAGAGGKRGEGGGEGGQGGGAVVHLRRPSGVVWGERPRGWGG